MAGDGPREYVGDVGLTEMLRRVRESWPGAMAEGAVGSWSWTIPREGLEFIVAEAWLHPTKPGWWLRIRKAEERGST